MMICTALALLLFALVGSEAVNLGTPLERNAFILNPESVTVKKGDSVTLQCIPKDTAAIGFIIWSATTSDRNIPLDISTNGSKAGHFLVPHPNVDNRYWTDLYIPGQHVDEALEQYYYQCKVYSQDFLTIYYSSAASIEIFVQAEVRLANIEDSDILVSAGETKVIPLVVVGKPTPLIILRKHEGGAWVDITEERFFINTTHLQLSWLRIRDEGEYQIEVSNSNDRQTSVRFELSVEGVPTISAITSPQQTDTPIILIVAGVVGGSVTVLAVCIAVVAIALVFKRRRSTTTRSFSPSNENQTEKGEKSKECIYPESQFSPQPSPVSEVSITKYSPYSQHKGSPYIRGSHRRIDIFGVSRTFEIPFDRLQLKDVLYETVVVTLFKGNIKSDEPAYQKGKTVAVKTIKDPRNESDFEDLLHEIKMMSCLVQHQNVVGMLGYSINNGQHMLVTECMAHGDLLGFLRASRGVNGMYTVRPGCGEERVCTRITEHDMLNIAIQIADGMSHLEQNKIIHKSLCARNVLVGNNMQVKVFNYGMKNSEKSRPVNYFKWMAPETFVDSVLNSQSDIWSYGVTLWEILTLGGCPHLNAKMNTLVPRLQQGYRLEKPIHVSESLYAILFECWNTTTVRPSFAQLRQDLQTLQQSNQSCVDLNLFNYQKLEFDDHQQSITAL